MPEQGCKVRGQSKYQRNTHTHSRMHTHAHIQAQRVPRGEVSIRPKFSHMFLTAHVKSYMYPPAPPPPAPKESPYCSNRGRFDFWTMLNCVFCCSSPQAKGSFPKLCPLNHKKICFAALWWGCMASRLLGPCRLVQYRCLTFKYNQQSCS